MDIYEEIREAVADFGNGVRDLRNRMDDFEKRANRPGAPSDSSLETPIGSHEARIERKALGLFARGGVAAVQRDVETKAMQVGSDPDGGFLVVSARSPTFIKKLHDASPVRRLARIENISTDALEIPVDTDQAGASWVGETEARPETSTPQVGLQRIPVHETYANPKVTQQLLDDSAIDLGAWLENHISERFGRQESTAFVLGTGIKQPRGFATYPTATTPDASRARGVLQHVVSGHATLLTPDALKSMVWTLRAPYRNGAAWLMASSTAAAISLFKDGQGNYLFKESTTEGQRPTLLGYPVEVAEDLPAVGAGALPVAFGNFSAGYTIVDRIGMRVLRDPYSSKPFISFYSYRRVGADVTDFDAIKLMLVST